MSTITKLDPAHRVRRTERRNEVLSIFRVAKLLMERGDHKGSARAHMTAVSLDRIRCRPDLHGHAKDLYFVLARSLAA